MMNTFPIALIIPAFTTLVLCASAWFLRRLKLILTSANLNTIALALLVISLMLIIDDQIGRQLDTMPANASFFLEAVIPATCYGGAFWLQTKTQMPLHKVRWWLAAITGLLLLAPLWFFMALYTECAMGNCL